MAPLAATACLLTLFSGAATAAVEDSAPHQIEDAALLQVRSPVEQPEFCTNFKDPIWDYFCNHWISAVGNHTVKNAAKMCCATVPAPCLESVGKAGACSTDAECFKPSCHQELTYIAEFEPSASAAFDHDVMALHSCAFGASRKADCPLVDAPMKCNQAKVDHLVKDEEGEMMAEYDLIRKEVLEVNENGSQSLLQRMSRSREADLATWSGPDEAITGLQWRLRPLKGILGHIGVVHSYLVAKTSGSEYQLEKNGQELLRIRSHRIEEGRTHAVARSADLRGGLTMAQLVAMFRTTSDGYNLAENNCHHAASKVFAWAAPRAAWEPPNPAWEKAAAIAYKTMPRLMSWRERSDDDE